MAGIEGALVERCLKRATDYNGVPYTTFNLAEVCARHVELHGPQATTCVRMKGVRGLGLKIHRRLFPTGPLGLVEYGHSGSLSVEFPSLELLTTLRGHHSAHCALASYYMRSAEPDYPDHWPLPLAIQFAQQRIGVELDADVIEAAFTLSPQMPLRNGYALIYSLLEVEHVARKRRWKRVDLAKWVSAGLTWPLVRPVSKRLQVAAKPPGVVYRLTERHAKLLRLFDKADEVGKQHLEQAARSQLRATHTGNAPRGRTTTQRSVG